MNALLGWEPPKSGHGLAGFWKVHDLPDFVQTHSSLSGSRSGGIVRFGPVNPAQAAAASATVNAAPNARPLQEIRGKMILRTARVVPEYYIKTQNRLLRGA